MSQPDQPGLLVQDEDGPAISVLGPDAVLVRFGTALDDAANLSALALGRRLEQAPPSGVVEIATALISVLVRFDPRETDHRSLAREVAKTARVSADDGAPTGALWHVPVAFGGDHGPHLSQIAGEIGLSETAAVDDITAADLRVLALGFAPGQPYLGFLPERWDLPRLSDLTPEVPAGALIVAVRQAIVFANPAPTGWRQIGQSHFPCLRPGAEQPVTLRPGDRLRFHKVAASEFDALAGHPLGGARRDGAP